MRRIRLSISAGLCAAVVLATGCSSTTKSVPTGTDGALHGSITVFAASSLKDTFTALGHAFEAAHPGTKVEFNFGASSTLASNIVEGAPADVFASASEKDMTTVSSKSLVGTPTEFASNRITLAVPASNPAHVSSVADLAKKDVTFVACKADVPCGVAAAYTLGKAGITRTPVTLEPDVKSTLNVLQLGEADAGFVYLTDVLASGGKVMKIAVPDDLTSPVRYPIATVRASGHGALGQAFVAYVLSPEGQAFLTSAGFGKP